MSYKIITIPHFDKEFKRLAKKHQSIKKDFYLFLTALMETPTMGTMITENYYKTRMAIASKGKSNGLQAIIPSYLSF